MPKELLLRVTKKDFDIQTFRSGGPGGQHQNKTDSGVRIRHRASGAVSESRSERSQHTNKKIALENLAKTAKFRVWLNGKILEIQEGKTLDQKIDEMMKPEHIQVEGVASDGKWQPLDEWEAINGQ